jgi:hypothetical protein
MSMKNSDTIGNRSRDLPVCSAMPQPLRHRVPKNNNNNNSSSCHTIHGNDHRLTTCCHDVISSILFTCTITLIYFIKQMTAYFVQSPLHVCNFLFIYGIIYLYANLSSVSNHFHTQKFFPLLFYRPFS